MKKYKIQKKNLFSFFITTCLFIILIISFYHIIAWRLDLKSIEEQIDDINDAVNIEEVNNAKCEEIIEQDNRNEEIIEQDIEIPKSNPYWDYIKMNLIDVNFSDLKKINTDVKGWIQINGTNINYPFVQTNNNDYYLTHSFNKSYNSAGWVFLDYRNDLSNFDNKNTIIYAHGRLDKTMFGSLKDILTNGWLNNTDNHIVRLSTEYENTLWQVFSVYHIPTTSDYIKTNFKGDEEFEEFANMLLNRSAHDFNTTISKSDRILTLSTCYNSTDKVVLHAKLIKRELSY